MNDRLTLSELKVRWEKALAATHRAAAEHPRAYRDLKVQAAEIIENPIDISDYFPAVEKLINRLKTLDSGGHGSIFDIFNTRISPSSIWHVKMLRMECKDLLAHLYAFDEWRRKKHRLQIVK